MKQRKASRFAMKQLVEATVDLVGSKPGNVIT